MSDSDMSSGFQLRDDENGFMFLGCESSDDDEKRLKRREKNRVAAQESRKRQTRRVDELHEAYECLEEKNSRLKKEVLLLSQEQRCLTEALKAHEPLCPFMRYTAAAKADSLRAGSHGADSLRAGSHGADSLRAGSHGADSLRAGSHGADSLRAGSHGAAFINL